MSNKPAIPPSPYFTSISLNSIFNQERGSLPDSLRAPINQADIDALFGRLSFRGIPFDLGQPEQANVLLLTDSPVHIDIAKTPATYVLFLHVVEDRVTNYQNGLADYVVDGNELGQLVSEYSLAYADGATATVPIHRRFAIQQSRIQWGASAFTAMPAPTSEAFPTVTEAQEIGFLPSYPYGRGETRHVAGRERTQDLLWIYALANPHPSKPITRITVTPREERSAIYAITTTTMDEHPLRAGVRQKVRLPLPAGATLNARYELADVDIDLGTVISARAALDYDAERWHGNEPVVQPTQSEDAVIIEYEAHPQAKLHVATGPDSLTSYDLAALHADSAINVNPAHRPVTVNIIDKASQRPVAVRLHMHGAAGEYLPPRGHHRRVNPYWFEDNYGEFVNQLNQYSYVPGECVVDLPLGAVYVEITRGYEITPIRTSVEITPETDELTFALERVLDWRAQGWVTADTHVHFLSPQTALLEGEAEGVNVVNLLASQWGEMFSNVTDFDGKSTLGARDFGGDGEFLVRVGTENRMQTLGHISLLGYSGAMIHPLCTGGPTESAIGDPQEVTMAEWAQRCIDQGGLVVMPHCAESTAGARGRFCAGIGPCDGDDDL